jgi:hypothetical protein
MLDFQFRFIFFILKLNNTCIKFSYLISKTINRQAEDEQSTEVPRLDFPINLQTEYKSNQSNIIKIIKEKKRLHESERKMKRHV